MLEGGSRVYIYFRQLFVLGQLRTGDKRIEKKQKYLFRFFAHFLIGLFGFFGVEFYKFFINLGY